MNIILILLAVAAGLVLVALLVAAAFAVAIDNVNRCDEHADQASRGYWP